MDDMKREMYMRVKDSLLAGKMHYLCWALVDELADFCNVTWAGGTFPIQGGDALKPHQVDMFLDDISPELFALHDGIWWVDEWLDSPKNTLSPKIPIQLGFLSRKLSEEFEYSTSCSPTNPSPHSFSR